MYSGLILIPFFSVILLNLPAKNLMQRFAFWLALILSAAQIYFAICPEGFHGLEVLSSIFEFNLAMDNLSRVLLLCIGIVLFVTILAQDYLSKNKTEEFNSINILLLMLSGMNGMVLVQDVFSLYVFLEVTAVASFILIAFKKDIFALEGAFKYIMLSVVATTLMLLSIALLLLATGSTGFVGVSLALKNNPGNYLIMIAIGLFLCAAFIKAGVMPFHGWLPDAYTSSPAPVSILLAGIATKVVGVYTVMRIIISVFGFTDSIKSILLVTGTISIVLGALASLGQNDFKRMLAYSSISQVGYIILGFGCGTALGFAGALFHLFNHCIFKTLLFVNSAAVESSLNTRDMDKMAGLAAKMPVTGATSIIASLSAAGIPPLAGFWSKLIIVIALWLSGYYLYAVIAVLGSVLTLAYFLSMQRRVFFGKLKDQFTNIKEAGPALTLPALILAGIIIATGVFFPLMLKTFIVPAGSLF